MCKLCLRICEENRYLLNLAVMMFARCNLSLQSRPLYSGKLLPSLIEISAEKTARSVRREGNCTAKQGRVFAAQRGFLLLDWFYH